MKWRGPLGGGAASGKLGALVASRAKNTQYLRARTKPVNPNTVPQQGVRNALKTLASTWQHLSDIAQALWSGYAVEVRKTNALGDPGTLSGVNWYVGNNIPRVNAGLTIITNGPTTFDLGNPTFGDTFAFDCGGTNPSTTAIINLGNTTLPIANDTESFLLCYVSRPFSPGRARPSGANQLLGIIAANTTTASHSFTSPFPRADTASGMQLTVRLTRSDGRLSSPFYFSVG